MWCLLAQFSGSGISLTPAGSVWHPDSQQVETEALPSLEHPLGGDVKPSAISCFQEGSGSKLPVLGCLSGSFHSPHIRVI